MNRPRYPIQNITYKTIYEDCNELTLSDLEDLIKKNNYSHDKIYISVQGSYDAEIFIYYREVTESDEAFSKRVKEYEKELAEYNRLKKEQEKINHKHSIQKEIKKLENRLARLKADEDNN